MKLHALDSARLAREVNQRDAFEWNTGTRSTNQQGVPFFHCFIPDPYQEMPSPPDYLCLPSPGDLRVPISIDRDCQYKLIYISYLVSAITYEQVFCTGPFTPRYVSDPPFLAFHPNDRHLTYNEHVDVEVIVTSQQDKYIYGEPNQAHPLDQVTSSVPIAAVKGISDGIGMLRTEYLVPKGGMVVIHFLSRAVHPRAIRGYKVNGFLYGLKYYA